MIHPSSRSLEWMKQVASENGMTDIALVEKVIRAFSLLESLVLSGCPFIFKGGTAVMLQMDSAKRLSIDIDIICPIGTNIEEYIRKCTGKYGFGEFKLVQRDVVHKLPVTHAKFFYELTYVTNAQIECVLLDVLFEDVCYQNVVKLPIRSRFLKVEGEPVYVNVPSVEDLLGDKLTAFAPNTTGIPYFKRGRDCSMEIIKQLFDIASLFDVAEDIVLVGNTFKRLVVAELRYRNLNPEDVTQVLDDIFQTSLCICLRGQEDPNAFERLQAGIKRIKHFIHGERYSLDSAIVNASKAAYLSTLIARGATEIVRFNLAKADQLRNILIEAPLHTKLNKLKKTNIEAFFYWNEIGKWVLHTA